MRVAGAAAVASRAGLCVELANSSLRDQQRSREAIDEHSWSGIGVKVTAAVEDR